MLLITSIASWAAEPYFEVVSGSFASGNVTVKATFPDATSVTPGTGAWIYLDYETNGNYLCYANGGNLNFPGDNTFTATFSFTCPVNAQDELFTVSPYANDISVDGVSQPRSLVIRQRSCAHESFTFHAATTSTFSTHGHDAYNECNSCGKIFRASDTEHTTPLALSDIESPLLCPHPYFEIVSGSFAGGDAKVKITFPKATEVALPEQYKLYYIKYGTGEQYYNDNDVVYVGPSKATPNGNSVTIDYSGSTFNIPENAADNMYYVYLYANSLVIDGEPNTAIAIHRASDYPVATIESGSLTEGTLETKVTIPLANALTKAYMMNGYGIKLMKGDDVLDYQTDNNDITVEGNTLMTTFEFTPQVSADLSNCTVVMEWGCINVDGSYNKAMTIPVVTAAPAPVVCAHTNLTHHDAVVPTYEAAGNIAYDECDDCHQLFAATDTEHETPITLQETVLPMRVMDVTNGIDPYFNITSGSFASGNVTVKITFPNTETVNVTNYMALQYNGSSWEKELKQLNGTGYTIDGNVVTATFSGFSAPAGADENKYSIKIDGVVEDGGEPQYYPIIRPAYAFPYAEVVEGSLATKNATVKITFPFAESIIIPSYEDCVLQPKSMEEASFYTRNTEVTTEGNAIFIPFTAHEDMFYTGRPEDFTVRIDENYFFDELYNRIGYCNIVFRPTDDCTHEDCIFTDEVLATPETPGMMAYNRCKRCGKLFAATDVNRETPVEMSDLVIAVTCDHNFYGGHECIICRMVCEHKYLRHFENRDATCIHQGVIEHWQCVDCNTLFSNRAATTQTTAGAVYTGLISHNYSHDDVCYYCGRLADYRYKPVCYHPNAFWHVIGRKTDNCTVQGERYMHCNSCYQYWLQKEDGTAVYMTLDQIENEIASGSFVHNGNLKVVEAKEATCTTMGYGRHKYCDQCDRVYPINMPDAQCTTWNALEKGLGDPCVYSEAPRGHHFVDGVCEHCDYKANYVEVTNNAGISITGKYILVSKFGDQYYAMANNNLFYGYSYDGSQGSVIINDGKGYSSVPVTRNADGSITLNNDDIAELTFTGKRLYWYTQNYTEDHQPSKVKNYILYDYKMGYLLYNSFDLDDLKVLHGHYNYNGQIDALSRRYRLDGYGYDRAPGNERNFMIYNGQKTSINGLNSDCNVWDGSERKASTNNLPVCDNGSLMFTQPGYSNVWKGMYAAKESNGDVVFGFADDYGRNHAVENLAPVHLYVIATEKFIGVEDDKNAMLCGPVSPNDLANLANAIEENNTLEQQELEDLKETDGSVDQDAAIPSKGVSLSVIDCSHATFTEAVTDLDIETLRMSGVVSKNGLILLNESAEKTGENIIVDGECESLVLTDKVDVVLPVAFNAAEASYSRAMTSTSQWGTLCLPFAITSNEDMQLYSLSEVDSESGTGVLTFVPVESAEAGQAVVFRKKGAGSTLEISTENAQLTAGNAESIDTDVENWAIKGSYTQTEIQSDADVKRYYIAQDKFWNAAVAATVPAFRAWFENAQSIYAATRASYIIFVEEGSTTSVLSLTSDGELKECTEMYDLNGKKISSAVKGQVNIINGRKIFVK